MITSHRASTGLVEKYIGTAYDNVKLVSEHLGDINKLATTLKNDIDFTALSSVLTTLGESVEDFAALSQADLALISKDLIKGNYLGNRKIDIDLSLNNLSSTTEVTYESVRIVTNFGVVIDIPFVITDTQGNSVVEELSSYTAIYNKIVSGINEFNTSEPNNQLHVTNTEIDIINSTLPDLPTMIRVRDADGNASNIDRIELQVHSGEAVNYRPAYFWANTTSALQTLANRVGEIISLGHDIDSIVLLASQRDEIGALYEAREELFGLTNSLSSDLSKLQELHTNLVALLEIQTNLPILNNVYENMASILYNEANMGSIVAAESHALTAYNEALKAESEANLAEGYKDEASLFRDEAESSKTLAEAAATTATQKNAEIKAISIDQTLTGNPGSAASVIYNSLQNAFTFVIPRGDKGEKGDAYTVSALGTAAEKVNYENQSTGFSFLDITNGLIYFKLSGATADWSVGFPFGQGPKGDEGDVGTGIVNFTFVSTTDLSGNPAQSGATDTYAANLTNGQSYTFDIKNGVDSAVVSVAGREGHVVLSKADVGLSQVDNTSDLNKPISNATKTYVDSGLDTKRIKWINTSTLTDKTLVKNERLLVSGASTTITLPNTPTTGDEVIVSVENFTDTLVSAGTNKIMGLYDNLQIDSEYSSVKFYYSGNEKGWVISV